MKVTLVPSSLRTHPTSHCLSTYLVNETVSVDAGSLGLYGRVADQARVRHVFLTHSHIDHLASLPLLLDNVYGRHPEGLNVYANAATLDCLRTDLFNDRLWPDFVKFSQVRTPPFMKLHELTDFRPVEVEGLRLTPVPVVHVVPTHAFVIESPDATVAVVTDTRPTDAVWEVLGKAGNVRGVFLEASFPDKMADVAEISGHLTPALFAGELAKTPPKARVIATHIKPAFHSKVVEELKALKVPRVKVGKPGRTYDFSPPSAF